MSCGHRKQRRDHNGSARPMVGLPAVFDKHDPMLVVSRASKELA